MLEWFYGRMIITTTSKIDVEADGILMPIDALIHARPVVESTIDNLDVTLRYRRKWASNTLVSMVMIAHFDVIVPSAIHIMLRRVHIVRRLMMEKMRLRVCVVVNRAATTDGRSISVRNAVAVDSARGLCCGRAHA